MSRKNLLFVTLALLFSLNFNAQTRFTEYNHLGLIAGLTMFDITTTDLQTKQENGFMMGFTTRGSFRGPFDLVYGINFYNSNIGILGSLDGPAPDDQFIGYTIQSAQINFLGSINIIVDHLSIEAGPVLNVNGKLKLDNDRFENYIIGGYSTIKTKDIEDISKINFRVMGGITAGLEHFRLSAQYQYGATNMLKNLNDKDLENANFEGHSGTIVASAVIYF